MIDAPLRLRALLIVALTSSLTGCTTPPVSTAPAPARPQPAGADRAQTPALGATCPTAPKASGAVTAATSTPGAPPACSADGRFALKTGVDEVALPAGRWVVSVQTQGKHYVSIGVDGPRKALRGLEVLSRKLTRLRTGSRDRDGRLPAFVSFESRSDETVLLVVDADAPVRVLRREVPRYKAPKKENGTNPYNKRPPATPLALIGLPFPVERKAGYFLQYPHRYQFARVDVVAALRAAFKQTRIRFKGGEIGVGDISQWNGIRPATDLDKARHISHMGGRDVDVGLPAKRGQSLLEKRCEGVLVENDVLKCAPGTVRGLDGMRLAYFLGLLIDGPTPGGRFVAKPERRPGPLAIVETIFTDQAYIDEVRKALPVLRKKRWIHDEAYSALAEEGLLRPSPWHVDHVHVRFSGPQAVVGETLDF